MLLPLLLLLRLLLLLLLLILLLLLDARALEPRRKPWREPRTLGHRPRTRRRPVGAQILRRGRSWTRPVKFHFRQRPMASASACPLRTGRRTPTAAELRWPAPMSTRPPPLWPFPGGEAAGPSAPPSGALQCRRRCPMRCPFHKSHVHVTLPAVAFWHPPARNRQILRRPLSDHSDE